MRFRLSLICLCLLVCAVQAFAQQAANSPAAAQPCANQPTLPSHQAALRPELPTALGMKLSQVCKPVLPGVEQGRKDLKPLHDGATYISFELPISVGPPPSLSGITADGKVVGYYSDANYINHGWIRYPDGTTASFDDPSAVWGTFAFAVNDAGLVTGTYWDINQQFSGGHGYLGTPGGTFTTFDVPGDSGFTGTVGQAINAGGDIAGYYTDANNNLYGFLRERPGTNTTFNIPGIYGFPTAINPGDLIVGWYWDSMYTTHAFLRDQNGVVSTVDPPAGTGISYGPWPTINPEGRIAGSYWQPLNNPFGGDYYGFVRHTDGTFETFNAANYGPCCIWTWATGIGPDGTVTGYLNDGHDLYRGYLRGRDGTVTLFDEPNAGRGDFQGTLPIAISTSGVVLGEYIDSGGQSHGFLRIPQ